MAITHNIEPGTVVRYSDDDETTYTIVAEKPSDLSHLIDDYPYIYIYAVDEDGDGEFFTATEFELGDVVVVSAPAPSAAPAWNEALIRLAIEYNRQVSFRYIKANGDIAERAVMPETIHVSKNGFASVVGYDPDRDAVRAYRLDRIRGDVTA